MRRDVAAAPGRGRVEAPLEDGALDRACSWDVTVEAPLLLRPDVDEQGSGGELRRGLLGRDPLESAPSFLDQLVGEGGRGARPPS
jgi:hypothetical protein